MGFNAWLAPNMLRATRARLTISLMLPLVCRILYVAMQEPMTADKRGPSLSADVAQKVKIQGRNILTLLTSVFIRGYQNFTRSPSICSPMSEKRKE